MGGDAAALRLHARPSRGAPRAWPLTAVFEVRIPFAKGAGADGIFGCRIDFEALPDSPQGSDAHMTTTITIPPPERHKLHVRGVGDCVMQDLARSGEARVGQHLRSRPHRANYRACVDDLISSCLTEPSLSPAEVSALSPAARRRLRFAALEVVGAARDYRRLAGSHLGRDERAFMAMRWRRERFSRDIRERLRGHRRRLEKQALEGRPRLTFRGRVKPAYPCAFKTFQGLGFAGSVLGRSNPALTLARSNPARLAMLDAVGTSHRNLSGLLYAARPKQSIVPDATALARTVGAEGFSRPLADQARLATKGLVPDFSDVISSRFRGLADGFGPDINNRRRIAGIADSFGLHFDNRRHIAGIADSLSLHVNSRRRLDGLLTAGYFDDLRAIAGGLSVASRVGAASRPVLPVLPVGLKALAGLGDLRGFRSVQEVVRQSWKVADRGEFVVVLYRELRRRLEDSPLGFLVALLDRTAAVALMQVEADDGLEAALDALAPAVASPEVLEALETGVANAPYLSAPIRQWLLRALAESSAGEWMMATPYLNHGVEGAFRDAARANGMTTIHRTSEYMVFGSRKTPLKSISSLFEHLPLDDERIRFLKKKAYAGHTNQYRHAVIYELNISDADFRRHGVVLLLALAIWLDLYGESRPIDAISDAVSDHAPAIAAGATAAP